MDECAIVINNPRVQIRDTPPTQQMELSLRTPRLLLRHWREEDRAEFIRVNQISDEFWRPWLPVAPGGKSLDQLFDLGLSVASRGMADGTQCRLLGFGSDGRLVGFFSLSEIVRGVFQNAYAGWRVSADAVGQGLGTEGALGLLDLAFTAPLPGLGLHRVQANIIPDNAASLRVAEKCGFRREGYAPRYLQIAGRWQDHIMFAKTTEEHRPVYLI